MYLFFDTETADLPANFNAPETDTNNWPRIIQIAWVVGDSPVTMSPPQKHLIKPEGFKIARGAFEVHRISTEDANNNGVPLIPVLDSFLQAVATATTVVAHNIEFDANVIGAECARLGKPNPIRQRKMRCTMKETAEYCRIPSKRGFKWPRLSELHHQLFQSDFANAHDALNDCLACMNCFFELQKRNVI